MALDIQADNLSSQNSNENNFANLTPLMRQYFEIKAQYPDTILLFQVGDFYEMFCDDAIKASSYLGIALTKRGTLMNGEPIPLCGVPVTSLDHYMAKLVRGGFHVAICDQITEPQQGKIVLRKVTQVLTPGTITDSKLLDSKSPSYLCSIYIVSENLSIIFTEILTGNIFATTINFSDFKTLELELSRFLPDEILLIQGNIHGLDLKLKTMGYQVTILSESDLKDWQELKLWMQYQFGENIYGQIQNSFTMLCATGLIYQYLRKNQSNALSQIKNFQIFKSQDYLIIDASSQKNLELVKNNTDGGRANTLFGHLDFATTSMGSRTIKKWLLRPLVKKDLIDQRLDALEIFYKNINLQEKLENILSNIGDLERIVGRIALSRANLQDYLALTKAIVFAPEIKNLIIDLNSIFIKNIVLKLSDFNNLYNLLSESLNSDLDKDWLIKAGYNVELDRLRQLVENGSQAILEFERKEQNKTGISGLKIRYNNIHGYTIEITKTNLSLVPVHYIRLQTLVAKERYTTTELKELEYDISRAQNEITLLEKSIFDSIKAQVELYLGDLKKYTLGLSNLDAILGLSKVSYMYGYTRPQFNFSRNIIIENGKHPIIHARLEHEFIPNSVSLTDQESLWIITGPNMGGKSTYLRQIALISIMAQMGCFVPAQSANLSILDRVFTRIGAGDNLAEGKSTFLVEMEETALICNKATKDSLVILDEVGRGTSTYDGMAIAQSVIEYIYNNIGSRCLFATHYHELTELSNSFNGIVSYHAASKKTDSGIILLHRIEKGVAQGSFGIEVAKIANLPETVISRAQEILEKLNS